MRSGEAVERDGRSKIAVSQPPTYPQPIHGILLIVCWASLGRMYSEFA
jgi:hypothetical protein